MRSIEMILMTKSSKYGGYCVAGFDCATGKWVRLTSADEESHGALNDEMLFDAKKRRCAEVLDRVRVEIAADVPGRIQVENVLLDGPDRIHILKRVSVEEALSMHPCEERDSIFESHHYMVETDAGTLKHSLEMVRAERVRVYTVTGSSGKPKYKVDFSCRGHMYGQLAMTDPAYYERGEVLMDEAAVVLSISDDEWSRANGHYIYAAKILPLKKNRVGKRWTGKGLLAGTALLLALAAGLWMMSMEPVYVTRHSGSRYHMRIDCEELLNPNAAIRVPTVVGKLFCKECSSCCE